MVKNDAIGEELKQEGVVEREHTKGPTEREKQFSEMLSIVDSIEADFISEKISIEDAIGEIKAGLDALLPVKEKTSEEMVEEVVAQAPRRLPI